MKKYALLFIASCLLASCGPPTKPDTASPLARQAEQLEREASYSQAAQLWQQLAQQSAPNERNNYLLAAANNLWLAGESHSASALLQSIDESALDKSAQVLLQLLRAEIALAQNQINLARNALATLPDRIDSRYRARRDQLEEELASLAQGPAAAPLRQLTQGGSQPGQDQQQANISAFVELARLPSRELDRMRQVRSSPSDQAWLDLALLARRYLFAPEQGGAAMSQWWNQHLAAAPDPATATLAVAAFQRSFSYPQRIAVLLPQQGNLKAAAATIRDGMLSAWAGLDSALAPEISFIPLSEDPTSAVGALLEAHEQNYDWVVGPLARESVDAVLSFPGSTLPLLLLNRPSPGVLAPPGLPVYTFALLPEDEARASADQALADGRRRALVLHSDDAWGERVANAFSEQFQAAGGEVLQRASFDPKESNHSAQLRSLLGLNEATARYRQLRGMLGLPVGFEPVPRQDAELVFLGARVGQARQLRPQLKFFDAGSLPAYATSQVYSGREDPRNDRDLDGVYFPITPWLLGQVEPEHNTPQPSREQSAQWFEGLENLSTAQLYALGLDVVRLLPYLRFLREEPELSLTGAHGALQVDQWGQVQRHLSPAHFEQGRPQLLPPAIPALGESEADGRQLSQVRRQSTTFSTKHP